MPVITIENNACGSFEVIKSREWLVTNAIGGYASSTVSGMNSRRYHGLLVAATAPPIGRLVMLSKLEEALIIDGERIELSTNVYGDDVVHPSGFKHLKDFRLDPFPVSTYSCSGCTIEKSIFMIRGENTTVIEYVLTDPGEAKDISLEVRPLIAFRDYHATTHENGDLNGSYVETPGSIRLKPYSGLPDLFLAHNADEVLKDGYWYRNFEYQEERSRGLDHREDLFSPLAFRTSLNGKIRFTIIASTEERLVTNAVGYRRAEIRRHDLTRYKHRSQFGNSELIPMLERAAEQFIVARPPFKTVIAGYHWFADWGRDAMISLPGLLLSTSQPDAAKEILLQYLKYIHGGMLPNRFPDQGETPEYNTVDATLWFFEAIWQYLNFRSDAEWRDEALKLIQQGFYPALKSIVNFHLAGTLYGIHADNEGFLWAGDNTTQLTWMDAKVGEIAITPRAGRPVEIQALWYNALCILEEFGREFGDQTGADYYSGVARKLRSNFERVFWNEDGRCLYDVAGEGTVDAAVRPNQVIVTSLRHCLLSKQRALQILKVVEQELLTPYGLRTLNKDNPQYRGTYQGDVWSRDSAYHQGTVWPWLAGPFFSAKIRFADDVEKALLEAQAWLDRFSDHLKDAGLGQVSEIFDGDDPHQARGCIAQAWSVAELLRLAKMISKRLDSLTSKARKAGSARLVAAR